MKKALLLTVLLCSFDSLIAQKKITTLRLKAGDVAIQGNMEAETITKEFRKGRFGEWTYSVLAFEKPVTNAQQLALKGMGIELLSYLPDNSYQVRMKRMPMFSQLFGAGVRAMINMPGSAKLGRELNTLLPSQQPETILLLNLQLQPGIKWNEVKETLAGYEVVLTKSDYLNQGLAQVNVPAKNITAVSNLPFVSFLNASFLQPTPLNQRERGLFGLTNLTSSEVAGRNLSGLGTTVGVGDNADPLHLDNTKNVLNRNPSFTTNNHGRQVTGVVGGDGLIEERYKGVAPNSLLIVDYFDLVLTKSATYFSDFGMTVTNNSYFNGLAGCPGNSDYNELSVYVDQQIYNNPFLQHIFSAGNDGQRVCSPYPLSFATIKSGYQVGKNVLDVADYHVGTDVLNLSSSKGPVEDGRLKPEITASGVSVVTTSNNNTYAQGFGTSFSSPYIAGVWALLTERYKQLHANALPKSALIKGALCNSADDRGNSGPDYSYGFGLVNPRRAVEVLENNRYFTGTLSTAGTSSQIIAVPANTRQVKVLLYWHDKEASPLASTALVNDLDLSVTDGVTTYLPWILNPSPATVNNPAVRGVDRINNIEQVTIDNPGANISINVSGFNVPNGPQEYFVVYEFLKDEIVLEHPYGGERFVPGVEEIIKWNAKDNGTNAFTIEVSVDDGATWSIVDANVPADQHRYRWFGVPNTPTNKGKIRVSRNGGGASATSPGNFTILAQPVVTATVPCEGYVNLSWTAVTGATDYEVLQLNDGAFSSLGTTNTLTYRVSGLNKTQTYWFTVRARMTDSLGLRAIARSITPSFATACTAAEFDNDLKIDSLLSPVHGRENTSIGLTATQPITVRIKNLDDVATSSTYTISYQVNGGTVVTESSAVSIAANSTVNYTFSATANLSAPGIYNIKVTVKQTGDTQTANDELTYVVKHVANPAVSLPFAETFEATGNDEYKTNFFALTNADRFDYLNTSNGRLRTFVNSGVAVNGSKAITLDAINYSGVLAGNSVTGTINLSSYTATQGLRFDFNFKNHGQLKQPGTGVWMRGSDTQPWVLVYNLSNNQGNLGEVKRVSININELGQTVSSSFQVRFDQISSTSANNATYDINGYDQDDGFTFDDIRIVQTSNDVLLTQLVAPDTFNCTPGNANITIKVKNTTATTFTNVPVYYRINNGTAVAGSIPSLAANTELDFTFPTQADLSAFKAYEIDAWVHLIGDDYPVNDSINNRFVYSSPVISSFPYLERFDNSNGNWFTDTVSYSSWRWGIPSKTLMKRSASEGKGWFTTLNSIYKQNENSYLYSPCFNLSSLTQPVLSFSHITQQEDNCNCDYHTLEYSTDNGNTWQRLTATNGTNWFDSSVNQSWKKSIQRWHVSSTEVPNASNIRFRIFLSSDEAAQYEGIGIDDIHIFEKATIYTGTDILNINQSVSGNNWIHFNNGGTRIASIHPMGQNLGSTDVSAYINSGPVRTMNNQYYLDRNLVIRSSISPTDSVLIRFYFTEQEAKALIDATGCALCIKLTDAYLAAVTKYNGSASFENGILNDGADGTFQFIDSGKVDVVPFNNGYYAEFKVKSFSEFWINAVDMGLTQTVTDVNDVTGTGIFIKNVYTDDAGGLFINAGNKTQIREMNIRIVNAMGQEVMSKLTSYSDTRLNINILSSGIYFVEIRDRKGKEQFVKKIVRTTN
ncbi:S8 family serine peptidase [Lacibacter sp.]|uniref:S8 family serine peptidase n=1 Tax=Lacibacter sp. TaxID=1915409 RepID=UPI002B4B941E|nr:S8 family serine peptidase [Lacibacter sp.]HLP37423.1 S8 family serine peptidase [Lacibacter sp.]